ncbi:MAG: homoserine dehydrogenase [Mycobacterium leprae]
MREVYIGLLGCGTVGSGVVELLQRRAEKIAGLTGLQPVVKRILVQDPGRPRAVPVATGLLTTAPEELLADREIAVVIESMGGIEPAKSYILRALQAGKHVITANKDLMALCGSEIQAAAAQAGVTVMYEAAVGGAIPLIRPLKECLTANAITDIMGIVNGTTNYILTKMTRTGSDFDSVLQEAQSLGYAEQDPSSDVDGLDAARKLVILAGLAFHAGVRLEEVQVEGIRRVTAADVEYAHDLGSVIKLVAEGTDRDGNLALQVRPTLVAKEHPLAHVSFANNALFVRGDAAGELMFYGRGAGSLPTASSIVGDLIEVLRQLHLGVSREERAFFLPQKRVDAGKAPPRRHYLRLSAADRSGVFAQIAGIFGDSGVSMETVLQKRLQHEKAEIVIVTHEVSGLQIQQVVDRLNALPHVHEVCNVMPVAA